MAEHQTLSAAERTALIARCRADLSRENGTVGVGTVTAFKARSAARSEATRLGIEWREPAAATSKPSGGKALADMTGPEIARLLSPQQRQAIAARLGGTKSASKAAGEPQAGTKASTAPQRTQTAVQARSDVREAIAESQGMPPPKPATVTAAKAAEAKGCHVLQRAACQPQSVSSQADSHGATPEPQAASDVWAKAIAANNPGGFLPGSGEVRA